MRPARRSERGGFTLVELLCVIGIIALLVAIVLPALSKARKHAKELQCAAMMRQWGQAFHLYAAGNGGVIPHTGDRSRNIIGYQDQYFPPYPQNESGYTYVLPPLLRRKSWADFPAYQKPTDDIWQCPVAAAPPDPSAVGYDVAKLGYHTYAANQYLDYDSLVVPTGFKRYPSFLKLSKARQASVTILMFETTVIPSQGYNQGPPANIVCMAGCYPNENARAFTERHAHERGKLGGNVMMLDGHVEWRPHLWDKNLIDPTMPPMTNRQWWPY